MKNKDEMRFPIDVRQITRILIKVNGYFWNIKYALFLLIRINGYFWNIKYAFILNKLLIQNR